MPSARAASRIKQLCCLGLGGEAIMPALLKALHELMPSHINSFEWADAKGEMVNLYTEAPELMAEVLPLFFSDFYNREHEVCSLPFTEKMRRVFGVHAEPGPGPEEINIAYRSDFYNLILRPVGMHHGLTAVIREGDGRARGMLQISRAEKQPGFTTAEYRLTADLSPFIAHALTGATDLEAPLVDSEDSGLIVADPTGRLLHLTSEAQRLLFMAVTPVANPGLTLAARHDLVLPEGARQLCRQLNRVFRDDETIAPPVWRHRNAWGGFVFRAYWLNNAAPETAPLIGITVKRQEPLPLKLLRHLDLLPLSARQSEVCLLLAAGHSCGIIAKRLDLSEHTVVAHCRQIYEKLRVHSRGELISKLMGM